MKLLSLQSILFAILKAATADMVLCTHDSESRYPFSHLAEETLFPKGRLIRGVPLQNQMKDFHLKIPVVKSAVPCTVRLKLPGDDGATVTMDPNDPCKNSLFKGTEDFCKDEWSIRRGFTGIVYHLRFMEENAPPEVGQYQLIFNSNVTVKFYLIESRVFKDTSAGAPLATFTDSDASINITDRNFAACVNYNHLLNNSDTEHFVSCTDRNKITAAVANIEADGESVVLEVDHRSKGIYTCECRFSKMTLVHELDKYMVRYTYKDYSDLRAATCVILITLFTLLLLSAVGLGFKWWLNRKYAALSAISI